MTATAGHLPAPRTVSARAWTTVAVERRGDRLVTDLRRGALSPYLVADDRRTARVALVGTQALLLGGDHVGIRVRVGAGAALEVVETSGTVAYDGRGSGASWEVEIVVEAGGALVWDGLPFVVSTGADVDRSTSVLLGADAAVCLRETLVLGRSGERGGRLLTGMRVDGPEGPVLVEELLLDGARPEAGVVGTHRVVESVLMLGRRPLRRPAPTAQHGTVVLDLDAPGSLARRLGARAHEVALGDLTQAWCREVLSGRSPPR